MTEHCMVFRTVLQIYIFLANTQDKDILFMGNDGGSAITALTLDMSGR